MKVFILSFIIFSSLAFAQDEKSCLKESRKITGEAFVFSAKQALSRGHYSKEEETENAKTADAIQAKLTEVCMRLHSSK